MVIKTKPITSHKLIKTKAMKIELTMTELLLLVDMIKNGIESEDNEGTDFYTESELNAKKRNDRHH